MAGRGRGPPGKANVSFTQEQLNAMGLSSQAMRAEMKQNTIAPPPVFPLLMNKPGPLAMDIKEQYLLMVKRDLGEFLKESSVLQNKKSQTEQSIVQPYGNKYAEILSEKPETKFIWKHLPQELKPNVKRKLGGKIQSNKKSKIVDIDSRLKHLEQLELKGDNNRNRSVKQNEDAEENEEQNNENNDENLDEDQPDEEMDMGTDYVNDYFDNGEGFEDEDDNMDEPVF